MTVAGILLIAVVYAVLLIVAVSLGKAARMGDDQMAAMREYEREVEQ